MFDLSIVLTIYVAVDRFAILSVLPVSAITLLPAISYTSMSYSLSLFSANRDDVGLGYNVGVCFSGALYAKFNWEISYTRNTQVALK